MAYDYYLVDRRKKREQKNSNKRQYTLIDIVDDNNNACHRFHLSALRQLSWTDYIFYSIVKNKEILIRKKSVVEFFRQNLLSTRSNLTSPIIILV
jgi:hypothetical protein